MDRQFAVRFRRMASPSSLLLSFCFFFAIAPQGWSCARWVDIRCGNTLYSPSSCVSRYTLLDSRFHSIDLFPLQQAASTLVPPFTSVLNLPPLSLFMPRTVYPVCTVCSDIPLWFLALKRPNRHPQWHCSPSERTSYPPSTPGVASFLSQQRPRNQITITSVDHILTFGFLLSRRLTYTEWLPISRVNALLFTSSAIAPCPKIRRSAYVAI